MFNSENGPTTLRYVHFLVSRLRYSGQLFRHTWDSSVLRKTRWIIHEYRESIFMCLRGPQDYKLSLYS